MHAHQGQDVRVLRLAAVSTAQGAVDVVEAPVLAVPKRATFARSAAAVCSAVWRGRAVQGEGRVWLRVFARRGSRSESLMCGYAWVRPIRGLEGWLGGTLHGAIASNWITVVGSRLYAFMYLHMYVPFDMPGHLSRKWIFDVVCPDVV